MFKGIINDKQYTDFSEYSRDLDAMLQSGKSFTCSSEFIADECDKQCEKACAKQGNKEKVKKFINENVIDFDTIYQEYLNSKNKEDFIKAIKDKTPYKFSEADKELIDEFTSDECEEIYNALERKEIELVDETNYVQRNITNIDNQYRALDKQRQDVYNTLKKLNNDVDNLLKKREEFEKNLVMMDFLKSSYNDLADILLEDMDEDEEEVNALEDQVSASDINSILNSFAELYSRLLK